MDSDTTPWCVGLAGISSAAKAIKPTCHTRLLHINCKTASTMHDSMILQQLHEPQGLNCSCLTGRQLTRTCMEQFNYQHAKDSSQDLVPVSTVCTGMHTETDNGIDHPSLTLSNQLRQWSKQLLQCQCAISLSLLSVISADRTLCTSFRRQAAIRFCSQSLPVMQQQPVFLIT